MLIYKKLVTDKLAELKAYCVAADAARSTPAPARIKVFFTPVENAVDDYFAAGGDLGVLLSEVAEFMCFDIMRRSTKYEHEFPQGLRSDFPVGYYDITECFYQFTQLLTISGAELYAAFVYGIPDDDSGGSVGAAVDVPLSNAILTAWAESIPLQPAADVARVTTLDNWCQDCGSADLVSLFENQGKVVEHLDVKAIAKIIYTDRKLLQLIRARGFSVYVPSYIS